MTRARGLAGAAQGAWNEKHHLETRRAVEVKTAADRIKQAILTPAVLD
jgi:hypothetical protein